MNLSIAALFGQAALAIVGPFVLWVYLTRRLRLGRTGWAAIGYGCLFFILGQFLEVAAATIVGGLLAPNPTSLLVGLSLVTGVVQQVARYVALRYVAQIREVLSGPIAAVYGLGHGGFQSIGIGLFTLAIALQIRGATDPAALQAMPPDLAAQAAIVMATPWYLTLVGGAIERASSLGMHVGLSMMVAAAIIRRAWTPFLVAVAWHTIVLLVVQGVLAPMQQPIATAVWLIVGPTIAIAYGAAAVRSSDGGRSLEGAAAGASEDEAAEPLSADRS